MKERGVVYIAVGKKYYEEAVRSAKSLLAHNNVDVTIMTDVEVEGDNHFADLVKLKDVHGDIRDKVKNMAKNPYKKYLFIDTDTLVVGNIEDVFDLLEKFDVAVAVSPVNPSFKIEDVPKSFPEFNTGVVGVNRNARTDKLMEVWVKMHERQMAGDGKLNGTTLGTNVENTPFGRRHGQPPFRRAMYHSDVRYTVLTPEYNLRGEGRRTYGEVKIIHSPKRDKIYRRMKSGKKRSQNLFAGRVIDTKLVSVLVSTFGVVLGVLDRVNLRVVKRYIKKAFNKDN